MLLNNLIVLRQHVYVLVQLSHDCHIWSVKMANQLNYLQWLAISPISQQLLA